MSNGHPYPNWQALFDAPRSTFFAGHAADGMVDGTPQAVLLPSGEALFTQSNARVLIGQAANGALRLAALPTQVYPAPTGEGEFGLGPGMYHHFDVAMYAGDLSYRIWLDGVTTPEDLVADDLDPETIYADHFLPLTRLRLDELEVSLVSVAPVAPDGVMAPLAPAPLPGPAGAIYVLHVRNTGRAKVGGKWTKLNAPFEAECGFSLAQGEEAVFETHVAMGASYTDVLPVIYELHRRSALEWLNLTAGFWRSRLGQLNVDAEDATDDARFSRDIYIRSLFDNFNCLQRSICAPK
ncbi:MAG: hypothetical protein M1546_13540 [Chloroflexi bacterium]|nr:hypothetical protein [Chloroflexota bacterium]